MTDRENERTGDATSQDSALMEELLSLAQRRELSMSRAQAHALASSLCEVEPRSIIAYIQAFCPEQRLEHLPQTFWTLRPEQQEHDIAHIVLCYMLAGLSDSQRDVLWLSIFLQDRSSYALFCEWLTLPLDRVMACVDTLRTSGLLMPERDSGGRIYQPIDPLKQWAARHLDTSDPRHQRLIRAHAAHLFTRFPPEQVQLAIYNSAAPPSFLRALMLHIDEIKALVTRLESVDIDLWAHGVLTIAMHNLIRLDVLGDLATSDVIASHHEKICDPVLATHLLILQGFAGFRAHVDLDRALPWFERARARIQQVSSASQRELLSLCLDAKVASMHERLELEPHHHAQVLDAWRARVEAGEADALPPELLVVLYRYASRLHFLLEHDELAMELSSRALAIANESGNEGLICLSLLEVAESCSRLGDNANFEAHCKALLERCPEDCFPRMVDYTRFVLGYLYFGQDRTGESYTLCARASSFYEEKELHPTHYFIELLLSVMDIERDEMTRALSRLRGVASMVSVEDRKQLAPTRLVYALSAILYAMCDEQHLATCILHDAQICHEAFPEHGYMSWGVAYIRAHVQVIQSVLHPDHYGSLSSHTTLLDTLRVQRLSPDQDHLFREGLLYMRQGFDRLMDQWLETHGVSLAHPVQLHLDSLHAPTWFAVNHLPPVSIKRRQTMRRILTALIQQSRQSPLPPPMTLEEIFAMGWPDEVASYESMQARVYNTISRMRRLGLDELIQHDGDGYQWNPQCHIVVEPSGERGSP